jgi:hypothetical protein
LNSLRDARVALLNAVEQPVLGESVDLHPRLERPLLLVLPARVVDTGPGFESMIAKIVQGGSLDPPDSPSERSRFATRG